MLEAEAWRERSQCVAEGFPTSAFFPDALDGVIAAQAVCKRCTVRGACLSYALDNRIEHGIWGGTSERERVRIRRKRRTSL